MLIPKVTFWFPLLLGVSTCEQDNVVHAADAPTSPTTARTAALPVEQFTILLAWYRDLGERRDEEAFGALVVRAARIQLGKPYDKSPQSSEPEVLRVDLTQFQCVSLVESSLAVASCVWQNHATEQCFVREIESMRYRDGKMDGFASRLHYAPDWLSDNERRGRYTLLTALLGGQPVSHRFDFMSKHPRFYPALAAPDVAREIRTIEERLSANGHYVLSRDLVAKAEPQFHDGDIVAVVSNRKPGLLVGHIGFVDVSEKGTPRLLHASSHHKRVLLTSSSIASYLAGRPYRLGLMLARPLPPNSSRDAD
ncbi:MAG: hypothetical protein A2289_10740 [Deltaproteobacteria bacterium RIFOXYA12_FULL_58_15]|nr:MAG: hypothetical protein A2289_10740 [Deltaproteobacteria bacterium RIFOXYA12_FULL_58_15]OGR15072.1 MAG: hypothetical protein A2341_01545 [Deltaproteobacteria bacterium RIFOXYB12_FULL_58_9]